MASGLLSGGVGRGGTEKRGRTGASDDGRGAGDGRGGG